MKSRKSNLRSMIYVWLFKLPKRSRKMLRMTARGSNAIWMNSRTTRVVRLKNSKYVVAGNAAYLRSAELHSQASISKQKSALQKHAVIVKTQQKELQTATLELGMCASRPVQE